MKARAIGLAALIVTATVSLARAQAPANPLAPPTASTAGICGQPNHQVTHPGVVCDCTDLARIDAICPGVSQVVCINDFQYNPPLLQAAAGETVAWVNLEFCGDFLPEDLVVNTLGVGCDPHHQVVTLPAIPGVTGDAITEQGICSPNDGVIGSQVAVLPTACSQDESNVRCHTFAATGVQHYTCMTNPGHTALMHGLIAAQ
jgi:plastocyanin